jgi:hypothetical protein
MELVSFKFGLLANFFSKTFKYSLEVYDDYRYKLLS